MNAPRQRLRTVVLAAVALAASLRADPACHAVIVAGPGGTPRHEARFTDWAQRFRACLVDRAGVPAANVQLVPGRPGAPVVAGAVLAAVSNAAARVQAGDQFVLFLAGHGEATDGEATLALSGPDLRVGALRDALTAIAATNQVILHCGAAAGDALATLSAADRVVIAGDAPGELTEPVFGEFLLLALERGAPGRPLLDVFNDAARETALWIRRIRKTETGWAVDGRESVRVFRKLYGGTSDTGGSRVLDASSRPDVDDAEVPLGPAPGGKSTPGARSLTEHAQLAEDGAMEGTPAVTGAGYVPLAPQGPGDPGWRARRVVLGRAALMDPAQ